MRIFFTFIFLLISGMVMSQDDLYQFQSRYHMLSPDELHRMNDAGKGFVPTPPPGGKVRSIAEYEPNEGVIVGYPGQFGIPFHLIAEMSLLARVYTIVPSTSSAQSIKLQYHNNGVDTSNCTFVIASLNSYWARDYSPWFIADSAHQVAIVDFPYNRPRPYDNNVPGVFSNLLNVDMYGMNVLHTGGNYMSDGLGKAASTRLVLNENTSLTYAQILDYHRDYLGIDTYYTLEDPMDDYIDHIDCWGKFLAPDKVLLGEVPSNDPRYPDYEALATWFAGEISSYGTPYQVYRTYSPSGQPYTNSFILNSKVFVPVVNSGGTPWNDSALAVYRRAMPGYDIVGVTGLSSKPWESTDALHCRVHEIPDRGMLYIQHTPFHGDVPQNTGYEVRAELISYAGSTIIQDSAYISYRYNSGPWHIAAMNPDTGHVWVGVIPDSTHSVTISYFIHGADLSGRRVNHPTMGSADPHSFDVVSTISVKEIPATKSELLVFPNPCDDKVYALIPGKGSKEVEARIYSLAGRQLHAERFDQGKKLFRQGIDTRDLSNGVYILELISGNQRYSSRILVLHP